jgi:biopolymer transport protein ExbD
MAEIIESDSGAKKGSKRRMPRKMDAGVDMTPMVDLMCLLITFFMLTTAFAKPKVMEITMPEKNVDPKESTVKVAADRTYSILLGENDKIYWYWHRDVVDETVSPIPPIEKWKKSNYSKDGIRKFLVEKNEPTIKEVLDLKNKVRTGELLMPVDTLNAKIRDIKRKFNVTLRKSPIILIKADEKAKYRNLITIIDEMAICDIASYAVVDPFPEELELLRAAP